MTDNATPLECCTPIPPLAKQTAAPSATHWSRRRALIALVLAATMLAGAPANVRAQEGPTAAVDVAYTLASPEPATHLYTVSMRVRNLPAGRDHVDLVLPVWTPGSYLVREFARNVQDFSAGGRRWVKTNKNTWRVWPEGRSIDVSYRFYANEMSVRTSHLDDTHGYVNGANLFMYVDGYKDRPVTLTVEVPRGWDVETGLARKSNTAGFVYTAPDYDRLVDSPIESGIFRRIAFDAAGAPHVITVWGDGNYDPDRLGADFKKIVEAAAAVFGGTVPYERYVFIVHLYPEGSGGLEHLNSTTVEARPFIFQKKEAYQDFLELIAHEFFHAWLVKRIRPAALGPFDYTAENYTRMLWLMEGTTNYYEAVLLHRAGLVSEEERNKELAKLIQAIEGTPGQRHLSLEEASFDAWIKYYRRNEHSINNQISYYDKGAVVSAMLDFEIRDRTGGAKSLDDVLRFLWETYALKNTGIPEDGVQPAVEAVAGGSFEEFFDRYIRGTDEIDYDAFLKKVGLRLVTRVKKDETRLDPAKPGAWLGANVTESGGQTVVSSILENSPAWKGGLSAGDTLLALDGVRVTAATLPERLADRAAGQTASVTVFRRDQLKTLEVVLGARPPDTYEIEKITTAPKPTKARGAAKLPDTRTE
jgi:predicted metalloprotease with PDZ domain